MPRTGPPNAISVKLNSPEGREALTALKAEPPRPPSREDKRRIHDTLISFYDDKRGHYLQGYNDDRLAKSLDVPRAWVSDVRDAFFGPELSESEAATQAELARLNAISKRIETEALDLATRAEAFTADITRVMANLARKAG